MISSGCAPTIPTAILARGRVSLPAEIIANWMDSECVISSEGGAAYNCFGWALDLLGTPYPNNPPYPSPDAFFASHGYHRVAAPPPTGHVIALAARTSRDHTLAHAPTISTYHAAKRVAGEPDWWESKNGIAELLIHRLAKQYEFGCFGNLRGYFVRKA